MFDNQVATFSLSESGPSVPIATYTIEQTERFSIDSFVVAAQNELKLKTEDQDFGNEYRDSLKYKTSLADELHPSELSRIHLMNAISEVNQMISLTSSLRNQQKSFRLQSCYHHNINIPLEDTIQETKIMKTAIELSFKQSASILLNAKRDCKIAIDRRRQYIQVVNLLKPHWTFHHTEKKSNRIVLNRPFNPLKHNLAIDCGVVRNNPYLFRMLDPSVPLPISEVIKRMDEYEQSPQIRNILPPSISSLPFMKERHTIGLRIIDVKSQLPIASITLNELFSRAKPPSIKDKNYFQNSRKTLDVKLINFVSALDEECQSIQLSSICHSIFRNIQDGSKSFPSTASTGTVLTPTIVNPFTSLMESLLMESNSKKILMTPSSDPFNQMDFLIGEHVVLQVFREVCPDIDNNGMSTERIQAVTSLTSSTNNTRLVQRFYSIVEILKQSRQALSSTGEDALHQWFQYAIELTVIRWISYVIEVELPSFDSWDDTPVSIHISNLHSKKFLHVIKPFPVKVDINPSIHTTDPFNEPILELFHSTLEFYHLLWLEYGCSCILHGLQGLVSDLGVTKESIPFIKGMELKWKKVSDYNKKETLVQTVVNFQFIGLNDAVFEYQSVIVTAMYCVQTAPLMVWEHLYHEIDSKHDENMFKLKLEKGLAIHSLSQWNDWMVSNILGVIGSAILEMSNSFQSNAVKIRRLSLSSFGCYHWKHSHCEAIDSQPIYIVRQLNEVFILEVVLDSSSSLLRCGSMLALNDYRSIPCQMMIELKFSNSQHYDGWRDALQQQEDSSVVLVSRTDDPFVGRIQIPIHLLKLLISQLGRL